MCMICCGTDCLIWDAIDCTLMLTKLFFFPLWFFHLQNFHKVTLISAATFGHIKNA